MKPLLSPLNKNNLKYQTSAIPIRFIALVKFTKEFLLILLKKNNKNISQKNSITISSHTFILDRNSQFPENSITISNHTFILSLDTETPNSQKFFVVALNGEMMKQSSKASRFFVNNLIIFLKN